MEFPDAEAIAGSLDPVEFPEFVTVEYDPPTPECDDPAADARAAVSDLPLDGLPAGASVAVGLGSRGITDVVPVARATIDELRERGFEPVVVPAMGSHGGARRSRASGSRKRCSTVRSTPGWRSSRSTGMSRSTSRGRRWRPTRCWRSIG
jgi:hypothetical protein